jgi:hypothetical protein
MQSRRNATISVNPIAAKNNIVVTLHLNNEKYGGERHASYGELHGDDTPGLYRVTPMLISVRLIFTSSPSSHPRFLKMEYDIRLTVAPPSMRILEISFPSIWPRMYSGFKCWLDSLGFLNTASLCHTPFRERGNEASICVPRMFKSHVQ